MKKLLSILIFGWETNRIIKTKIEYNQSNIIRIGAEYFDDDYSIYSLRIKEHSLLGKNKYVVFNDSGKISFKLELGGKIVLKFIFLAFIQLPLKLNNFDFSNFWVKSFIITYFFSNCLTFLNQYKNEQIIKTIIEFKMKMMLDDK